MEADEGVRALMALQARGEGENQTGKEDRILQVLVPS